MKRSFTTRSFSAKWIISRGILALSFSALFCIAATCQNSGSLVEFGDLTAVKWKTSAGFDQTLLQENAKMDLALSPIGLQPADRALYLAYKRLISYIQADVQAGENLGNVFLKRYEQVLGEAPSDPDLKALLTGTLEGLLPGLVEALTESPVPTKAQ